MSPRALASALVLLAGCERVVGINDLEVVHSADAGPADSGPADAHGDASACPRACVGDGTACGDCIQKTCCCEALDCSDDAACAACLGPDLPAVCSTNKLFGPYLQCARSACKAECGL